MCKSAVLTEHGCRYLVGWFDALVSESFCGSTIYTESSAISRLKYCIVDLEKAQLLNVSS